MIQAMPDACADAGGPTRRWPPASLICGTSAVKTTAIGGALSVAVSNDSLRLFESVFLYVCPNVLQTMTRVDPMECANSRQPSNAGNMPDREMLEAEAVAMAKSGDTAGYEKLYRL